MKTLNFLTVVLTLCVVEIQCSWIQVQKTPSSPCYKFKCPFGQRCSVINNQPICKCNHNCAKSTGTGPVCTSSGRLFKNLCELKKEECRKGHYILIDHYGNCTKKVTCFDKPREKRKGLCAEWFKNGACKTHQSLMWKFCRKTCNFCDKPDEPPKCSLSRYGCCRGTNIPAIGPNNKGCFKGCRDGRTCPFFPNFCGNGANEETMRKYCPFTCRYCVPDGKGQVEQLSEDNL